MLDQAFQNQFFRQLETLTDVELEQKIETVQTVSKNFDRGSEAASDSHFMLRHMRRFRADRLFSQKAAPKH